MIATPLVKKEEEEEEKKEEKEVGKEEEQVITSCDFWPEICTHLENRRRSLDGSDGDDDDNRSTSGGSKTTAPRLELTCSICRAATLRLPRATMSNREGLPTEDLTVAPCGHVFGAQCLAAWMSSRFAEGAVPGCPACRFPLLHSACGHYLTVRGFSFDGDEEDGEDERQQRRHLGGLPDRVPVVVPRGGRVPPFCGPCREQNVRGSLLATLTLAFSTSHLTRDGDGGPEARDDAIFYLSGLLTNSVMEAYALWTQRSSDADEWI